jgi:hypothetical protein
MILNWRLLNGWTQYTVSDWGKEVGFSAISYGNLSVLERGRSGELRHIGFLQLAEVNDRINRKDWGNIKDLKLRKRVQAATVCVGDEECKVWGPGEFWACYCGLRDAPTKFMDTPPPILSKKQVKAVSSLIRSQMRDVVKKYDLDPLDAIRELMSMATTEQHRNKFSSVLMEFSDYSYEELNCLWSPEKECYLPLAWFNIWKESVIDKHAD